ncbi:DUF2871 domain-containing protein [Amycolatopsis taiwanensis]|uniref:DUF2871 domain-containing protein n=1 Tax=Amycolatopsis taiwanensis TaxID=342230 RepID=UPI000481390A|nr:DUF2871 domain-containing protein [Amycolatopsis taiwanensis]
MRKILITGHIYMILGVAGGLYYREITKMNDFTGDTQLSVVHTHLLTLGMLFFLVVLALEKLFDLTSHRLFGWFFWVYNVGLAITVGMLILHGTLTVLGRESSEAIAGIAGLGHILLTAGLILLFTNISKRLPGKSKPDSDSAPVRSADPAQSTAS